MVLPTDPLAAGLQSWENTRDLDEKGAISWFQGRAASQEYDPPSMTVSSHFLISLHPSLVPRPYRRHRETIFVASDSDDLSSNRALALWGVRGPLGIPTSHSGILCLLFKGANTISIPQLAGKVWTKSSDDRKVVVLIGAHCSRGCIHAIRKSEYTDCQYVGYLGDVDRTLTQPEILD
ncbi:hypothetical protein K402DRAFT_404332 [Aulographum hederae CBS 113979]|uniref:Uncharacterized protein n=1 Tax=Aulographum hederae CBS 113979 TaxID=1176131 RepID=A0A6G1H0S2_9PEZI|nr:hypothetical protein K402DRAFT_404332 [Aulographum hederae CBS 113979]